MGCIPRVDVRDPESISLALAIWDKNWFYLHFSERLTSSLWVTGVGCRDKDYTPLMRVLRNILCVQYSKQLVISMSVTANYFIICAPQWLWLDEVSDQPNPLAPTPAPAPIPQEDPTDGELVTNNDTTESTDSQATSSDTAPVNKEKKCTLITKSFTLPRRVRPVRSFKCGVENCNQVFGTVKDLNQHHQDNHPPVKCDMYTKYFSCPNKMLKQIQALWNNVWVCCLWTGLHFRKPIHSASNETS